MSGVPKWFYKVDKVIGAPGREVARSDISTYVWTTRDIKRLKKMIKHAKTDKDITKARTIIDKTIKNVNRNKNTFINQGHLADLGILVLKSKIKDINKDVKKYLYEEYLKALKDLLLMCDDKEKSLNETVDYSDKLEKLNMRRHGIEDELFEMENLLTMYPDNINFNESFNKLQKELNECVSEELILNETVAAAVEMPHWDPNFFPSYTPEEMVSLELYENNPWFEWYKEYYNGKRDHDKDLQEINQWKAAIQEMYRLMLKDLESNVKSKNVLLAKSEKYLKSGDSSHVADLLHLGWDWRESPFTKEIIRKNQDRMSMTSSRSITKNKFMNEAVGSNMTSTQLRSAIERDIYKLLNLMDDTGRNTTLYKQRFSQMSDKLFFTSINRLFTDEDYNLVIQYIPYENNTSFEYFNKVAEKLGIILYDYLVEPYLIGHDGEDAPVTVHKVYLGLTKEKRLVQNVLSKVGVSTSASKRNSETGQVTGKDKNARVSDVELYSLIASNQTNAAVEFMGPRADNFAMKKQMLQSIKATGEFSMENLQGSVLDSVTSLTLFHYFAASGLRSNLIENTGLILPQTLLSKDIKTKVD